MSKTWEQLHELEVRHVNEISNQSSLVGKVEPPHAYFFQLI